MSATNNTKKAVWARCPECGHCWAAAYYPVPLADLGKIIAKHCDCPKCDSPGVIAKQQDGELIEPAPTEASKNDD